MRRKVVLTKLGKERLVGAVPKEYQSILTPYREVSWSTPEVHPYAGRISLTTPIINTQTYSFEIRMGFPFEEGVHFHAEKSYNVHTGKIIYLNLEDV